jgi:hypothetical protein
MPAVVGGVRERSHYSPSDMRLFLSGAILTASLMICSAEASAESHMIGLGNQTCSTWTANPPATSGVGQLYQQWTLGFLSGVSFADPKHDPLSNLDAATVAVWFEDYCRDNATARLVDAATAFVRAHQPAKN